jgi:hypothetical protein
MFNRFFSKKTGLTSALIANDTGCLIVQVGSTTISGAISCEYSRSLWFYFGGQLRTYSQFVKAAVADDATGGSPAEISWQFGGWRSIHAGVHR